MYNKKEMEMLAKEFLAEERDHLVKDLVEMRTQMNEMYTDYFTNMKPVYNKTYDVMEVLKLPLQPSQHVVLLHFIELEKQNIKEVNVASVCKQINKTPQAYGKTVRNLCELGYLSATHRRGTYKLNKVF